MIFNYDNYRIYLRDVLEARSGKNPSYSLRAMAMQLDLAPSTLSQILSGRKNFSPQRALNVSRRLGLTEAETDYFCMLVQLEASKDPVMREKLLRKVRTSVNSRRRKPKDMQLEAFQAISDWHHVAIMEMTGLEKAPALPQEIARKLRIPSEKARMAASASRRTSASSAPMSRTAP